jgi:hypothetical protein
MMGSRAPSKPEQSQGRRLASRMARAASSLRSKRASRRWGPTDEFCAAAVWLDVEWVAGVVMNSPINRHDLAGARSGIYR